MIVFIPSDRDRYPDIPADPVTERVAMAIYLAVEPDVTHPTLKTWEQSHPACKNNQREQAAALIAHLRDLGLTVKGGEDA